MNDRDSKLLWEAYLREDEQPLLPGMSTPQDPGSPPPPRDHMKTLASRMLETWSDIQTGATLAHNAEQELYDWFYDIPREELDLSRLAQHLQSVPELVGWLNGRPLEWVNKDMRTASQGRPMPQSVPPFDASRL
jgi:hypothetical protein